MASEVAWNKVAEICLALKLVDRLDRSTFDNLKGRIAESLDDSWRRGREAEREVCADLAEELFNHRDPAKRKEYLAGAFTTDHENAGGKIAAAIRARSGTG
jgi:hypothetical protein